MSIDRFLALAEQGGFLDRAATAKLRAKIERSDRTISLEELSAWLVKRGQLTPFQADKLLQATRAADSRQLGLASHADDSEDATFRLGPVRSSDTRKSLELLDDVDDPRYTLLNASETGPEPAAAAASRELPGLPADMPPPMSLDRLDSQDDFQLPGSSHIRAGWLPRVRSIFRRRPKRGQRWDSSLMLVGGGGLLALLLVGWFLYSVLAVGSGDEVFQSAEDDYNAQLYTQAIQKFEGYLRRYPKHGKVSLARVRMSLARMRTDVAARDWPQALETVKRELEVIRPEASFDIARSELAGILPEIYNGFVDRAQSIEDTDAKERLLDEGDETLALIQNPDHLPASLRRQIEARVVGIQEESEQVRREIARRRDIAQCIEQIQQAIGEADSAAAYVLRDQLLERHPGATKDAELQATLAAISGVERQSVRVLNQPIAANHQERAFPAYRSISLVMRREGTADALRDRIVAVNARGALYGLDGLTGRVLWRRWVGFQTKWQPVLSSSLPGADVLIVDQRFGELICLDAPSGLLKWRVEVGRPAGPPVVINEYLLQAVTDGTLFSINLSNGTVERRVQFPQQLTSPPGVDPNEGQIFQAASHSTMYILDAATLACTGTLYTGHLEGSVQVPPVVTNDLILMPENGGADYCQLHVLARKPGGDLFVAGEPVRLKGIVGDPPLTFGRTVVATTDRGAVYVMEAAAGNLAEPLRVFAQVHPRSGHAASHFAQLSRNRIFVAGWGLSEFEILAARGTLERRWAEQVEDSHFLAPAIFGDTIVTARWSPLTRDVIVEAERMPQAGQRIPDRIWQSRIAAQPAAPPWVMPDRSVQVVGHNGAIWRIDSENVGHSIVESKTADMPAVGQLLVTQDEAYVYTSGDDRPQWMFAANEQEPPRLVLLDQAGRRRLDATPVLFADGMLLCTRKGPVVYVSPSEGRPLARPLPWPASFASSARWRTPATRDEFALLANSHGIIQRLEVDSGDGQLIATKTVDLKLRLRLNPVVVGGHAYLVTRGRVRDTLLILSSDSLQQLASFPLTQRVVGPLYVVGDRVVLQTESQMSAFHDAEQSWQAPLSFGLLAGAPTATDGRWWCASRDGHLYRMDPATGASLPVAADQAAIEVGQALGGSVTTWGKTALVAGHDSTLHVIPLTGGGDRP